MEFHGDTSAQETLFSSCPVFGDLNFETTTILNIPVDGVAVTILPRDLDILGPAYVKLMDKKTLEELKTLQTNLNQVMDGISRNWLLI